MNYAKIEDGVVVNVIVADEIFAAEHNLVVLQENSGIGWFYDNGVFTAPLPTESTPPD